MIAPAIGVFLAALAVDVAHARYVVAVEDRRRASAAAWSVAQWACSCLCLLVAVKVSFWLLPLEALGLAIGTFLAVPRVQPAWDGDTSRTPSASRRRRTRRTGPGHGTRRSSTRPRAPSR